MRTFMVGMATLLVVLSCENLLGQRSAKPGSYVVRYEVLGGKHSVEYTIGENGSATFQLTRFLCPITGLVPGSAFPAALSPAST